MVFFGGRPCGSGEVFYEFQYYQEIIFELSLLREPIMRSKCTSCVFVKFYVGKALNYVIIIAVEWEMKK